MSRTTLAVSELKHALFGLALLASLLLGCSEPTPDPEGSTPSQSAICGDGTIDPNETCDDGRLNSDAWSPNCRCNASCSTFAPCCGDGVLDPLEACDDGAEANSDIWGPSSHCNADCTWLAPYCGDGMVTSPEEYCDDGADSSDGWRSFPHCNGDCTDLGSYCGDGRVDERHEACDDGAAGSHGWAATAGCRPDCSGSHSYCGDGNLDLPNEACDAGQLGDSTCGTYGFAGGTLACDLSRCEHDWSGCTGARPDPVHCGDGVVNGLEQCDGRQWPEGALNQCRDWAVDPTEWGDLRCGRDCLFDLSGCGESDGCTMLGLYGDGFCDDCEALNGTMDPDCIVGCSADGVCASHFSPWTAAQTCSSIGLPDPDCQCGDGIVQMFGSVLELCDGLDLAGLSCLDYGFNDGVLACRDDCLPDFSGCTMEPPVGCGDGAVDAAAGEVCDLGWYANDGSYGGCNRDCSLTMYCGDGIRNWIEACDEGGVMTANCNDDCTPPACGDARWNPLAGEECDDGVANSDTLPNSCRTDCMLATCGDGVVDSGEVCDDGFADICGSCNDVCDGPGLGAVCGDGVRCPELETCDEGGATEHCTTDCAAVVAVSAGLGTICGVRGDGSATCWSRSLRRLCGFGPDCDQSSPEPGALVAVSAGYEHACGLTPERNVYCWGRGEWIDWYGASPNDLGQSLPPPGVFSEVVVGEMHSCGLRPDGSVECWGAGSPTDFSVYQRGQGIPPPGTFTQLAAGKFFTCGIRSDGSVSCWGSDLAGISDPPPESFRQITAGRDFLCGILELGATRCWGRGTTDTACDSPERECGQAMPPSEPLTTVDAGFFHACGLRADGTVICWGAGGPSDPVDVWPHRGQASPPAETFAQISAGGTRTCGITTDGRVVCWGSTTAEVPPDFP